LEETAGKTYPKRNGGVGLQATQHRRVEVLEVNAKASWARLPHLASVHVIA